MDNAFLRSYLKMRESLTDTKSKVVPNSVIKLEEKPEKGVTLMTIIEECPPKAKVLDYLRKRIEEIEAEDD